VTSQSSLNSIRASLRSTDRPGELMVASSSLSTKGELRPWRHAPDASASSSRQPRLRAMLLEPKSTSDANSMCMSVDPFRSRTTVPCWPHRHHRAWEVQPTGQRRRAEQWLRCGRCSWEPRKRSSGRNFKAQPPWTFFAFRPALIKPRLNFEEGCRYSGTCTPCI
jgi:hypothetical protein